MACLFFSHFYYPVMGNFHRQLIFFVYFFSPPSTKPHQCCNHSVLVISHCIEYLNYSMLDLTGLRVDTIDTMDNTVTIEGGNDYAMVSTWCRNVRPPVAIHCTPEKGASVCLDTLFHIHFHFYAFSNHHIIVNSVNKYRYAICSYSSPCLTSRAQIIIAELCVNLCQWMALESRTHCRSYRWFSARLQYFQCVSNGDTAVLH